MAETIQKTFDTPEKSRLVIENIKGPITVTGWDRSQIEVSATPDRDGAQIEIDQHGNTVVARTKTEQGAGQWLNWFSGGHVPRVEYTAHVPYFTDLEIKNVEGAIAVHQSKGNIRLNNVDGDLTLDHAQGDIQAETVNGALSASHVRGKPQFKTVNGNLTVQESTLAGLSAHTVNGKIVAAAAWDADAEISLHTVNGDGELTVPADFRARASAHGVNVSVTCGQAETVTHQFGGWQGTLGPEADSPETEPLARIAFHTVNGHLRIKEGEPSRETTTEFVKQAKAEPEAEAVQAKISSAPAEKEPVKAKAPASQLEILKMVERGEITVQEALVILEP